MIIVNKFNGTCIRCARPVAPGQGEADGKWSCYCDAHKPGDAPARPSIGQQMGKAPDATIALRMVGDRIQIRPVGFLGPELFQAYLAATGGCEYKREERCNYATADLVGAMVGRLIAAGFKLDTDPAVTAAVQAWESRAKADTEAAAGRAAEIDAALRERGLALFPFQVQGVDWLTPLNGAILADDMGLGKTVMALTSLPDDVPVLVVAPAVAKGVWARECARWRPDLHVVVLEGRNSFRWPPIYVGERCKCLRSLDSQIRKDGIQECCNIAARVENPSILRQHATNRGVWHRRSEMSKTSDGFEPIHQPSVSIPDLDSPCPVSTLDLVDGPLAIKNSGQVGNVSSQDRNRQRAPMLPDLGDGNSARFENLSKTVTSGKSERSRRSLKGSATANGISGDLERFDIDVASCTTCTKCGLPIVNQYVYIVNYDILPDLDLLTEEELKEIRGEIKALSGAHDPGSLDGERRTSEALGKLYAQLREDEQRRAFVASCPAGLCVIADEAHAVKGSPKKVARAARFKAVADAAYDVGKGRVWLLTATPILNRPPELWNLLGLIRAQKVVFGSYPRFKKLCGGNDSGWGTTWNAGGIHADTIAPKLREVMLRRIKTDVLTQLPAKTVEIVEVSLDADSLKKLDVIKAELAEQGIDIVAALKAAAENRSIAFDQIARARAILATAKTAAAMEMADELAEAGELAVVFSAHRAPVDTLAKRAGWASITGDTAPSERTRIEEAFQRGEYRGISGTIKAAGVAITLTRAANAIFVDSEWTPKLNEQAEDRIYRIGQAQAVKITYLKANHEIDDRVFELCAIKRGIVARTVDAAAHREGPLAARMDVAAALEGARASADARQREADNEALAARVREDRAKAEAESVQRKSLVKAEGAASRRGWSIDPELFNTPPRAAQTPAELWAVDALARLTAVDGDYAKDQNGIGFSQADTHVGHALAAAASAGMLTTGEWMSALQLLRTYHRQIGEAPNAV